MPISHMHTLYHLVPVRLPGRAKGPRRCIALNLSVERWISVLVTKTYARRLESIFGRRRRAVGGGAQVRTATDP